MGSRGIRSAEIDDHHIALACDHAGISAANRLHVTTPSLLCSCRPVMGTNEAANPDRSGRGCASELPTVAGSYVDEGTMPELVYRGPGGLP